MDILKLILMDEWIKLEKYLA